MSRKRLFSENQKENILDYEEIVRLYHFFKKYEANKPHLRGTIILKKLYFQIGFETYKNGAELKSKEVI